MVFVRHEKDQLWTLEGKEVMRVDSSVELEYMKAMSRKNEAYRQGTLNCLMGQIQMISNNNNCEYSLQAHYCKASREVQENHSEEVS
jgi:hypothetical protein